MIGASKATSTREYQVLSTTTITSTGNQNYTIPAGVVFLEVEMYGGGGGGGAGGFVGGRGGSTNYGGGGGGGGAYVKHRLRIADLRENDTLNFTVGAAGAGSTSTIAAGTDGVDTQLLKHERGGSTITAFSNITAGAGGGGASALQVGSGGSAGVATNGNITNTNGSAGTGRSSSQFSQNGNNGGAAGGPDGGNAGTGRGTGGGAVAPGSPGGGGGGGSSASGQDDGVSGADGKVIVKAFG